MPSSDAVILAWRHPQPKDVAGRCIGQSDVGIDRRKAKRLAHRVRRAVRLHGAKRVVYTSPLQRCHLVGRILRSWGWVHHVDTALLEASFGAWDGLHWQDISREQIDAWVADFANYQPGGGESLRQVLNRAQTWQTSDPGPIVVIGHAGWMLARQWGSQHALPPEGAHQWPRPPAYGQCWSLPLVPATFPSQS